MIDITLTWLLYFIEIMAMLYLILISMYTYGLFKLRRVKYKPIEEFIPVTVVVAMRNEAGQIIELLKSFTQQDYPSKLLKMLVIDDHSEDDTANKVNDYISWSGSDNIQLLYNNGQGKKDALWLGLNTSRSDLVLMTDADCLLPVNWVKTMASAYMHQDVKMLLGPVRLVPSGKLLMQFQELEFLSLLASTAGAAAVKLPLMGNGANIGLDRKSAIQIKTFHDRNTVSGDDMFTLIAMRKKYGNKAVSFVYSSEAQIETQLQYSLNGFIQQRMRWVSKSRSYRDINVVLSALIVALFNFSLLLLMLASFYSSIFLLVYLLFVLFKFMIDYPLMYIYTGFAGRRKLLRWLLPLEFLYPVYVSSISLIGLVLPYHWKGRVHNK